LFTHVSQTTPLNKRSLNQSSSGYDRFLLPKQNDTHPALIFAAGSQVKRRKLHLKTRLSSFELNNGIHKMQSSQLKLEKEFKIHRMMSKPGVLPRKPDESPPKDKKSSLTGTNLHDYSWNQTEKSGEASSVPADAA